MLRVCTSVRSTMPIHVATIGTSSSTAASSSSTGCRAGTALPREEPAPTAVGVVLVPEAAHEAAHATPAAAEAEHGGARWRVRRRQPPGYPAHRDENNAHTCKGSGVKIDSALIVSATWIRNEQTVFPPKLAFLD